MADPHPSVPFPADVPTSVRLTRASVDAGAVCTSYVRAGSGAPVVLLDGSALVDGRPAPLVLTLASRFRVVTPDAQAATLAGTAFSTWLRGVLDGLGLVRASIVAREEYALRALGFCLTDPLRVARLVLLYRDAADPALGADAVPDRLDRIGVPILVHRESTTVPLDDGACPAGAATLAFLLADDASAG